MAKSGSITQYFYTKKPSGSTSSIVATTSSSSSAVFSLTFTWETVSQDIITNKSNIQWTLQASEVDLSRITSSVVGFTTASSLVFGTDDYASSTTYNDIEVTFNDTLLYSTTNFSLTLGKDETKQLASGSFNIDHKSDGTQTVNVSAMVRVKNAYDSESTPAFRSYSDEDFGSHSKAIVSGTIIPDAITRKAVITSASDFYDEESPTIEIAIPNTATSVQVGISFTGEEMNIPYRSISKTATSYTFNFSSTEYSNLVSYLRTNGVVTDDGLAAPVRFYIITDGSSSKIDYVTRTATLIDYKPFLEPEVYDTNTAAVALTGDDSILIKYISKAYYAINALGRKGATISTMSARNGDLTLGTATGTFEGPTDYRFYFDVIDNYGNRSSFMKEVNFVEYVKLTCSAKVSEMTADGDVSITLSGKYFNSTFGREQNNLSLYYTYTEKGGSTTTKNWHVITPTISGDNYSYTFPITGLNYMSVYDLHIEVKDKAMPSPAQTEVILASEPIFDWGRNDFNFNVPISFNGIQMMDFITENGVSGNWRWRKWNSGLMEIWGFTKGTVDVMTQWGGVYRSNANIQASWPIAFVDYPYVQATPSYDDYGNYWLATYSTQSGMALTPSYQICLGENAVNVNYKISFYAIGKWK